MNLPMDQEMTKRQKARHPGNGKSYFNSSVPISPPPEPTAFLRNSVGSSGRGVDSKTH